MSLRHWSVASLALATLGPGSALAQTGRAAIRGQVVSGVTLQPIEGATIVLRRAGDSTAGDGIRVSSNKEGRFGFERLAAGRYLLQASHATDTLPPTPFDLARTELLEVELTVGQAPVDPAAAILPELRTEAPRTPRSMSTRDEFERRRSLGIGQFITREMILQRNPPAFMDLFRMATGIEVRCRGTECLPRVIRARPGCYPQVIMDDAPTDIRVLLSVRPGDVQGMEIYLGLAEGGDHCGIIVVWTRLGMDERDRKPLRKPTPP